MSRRLDRLVRDALAREIPNLRDPRIPEGLCVTWVDLRPGGADAVVGISGAGGEDRSALRALDRASGYLVRVALAPLPLRRLPTLQFVWDDRVESRMRLDRLIEEATE